MAGALEAKSNEIEELKKKQEEEKSSLMIEIEQLKDSLQLNKEEAEKKFADSESKQEEMSAAINDKFQTLLKNSHDEEYVQN